MYTCTRTVPGHVLSYNVTVARRIKTLKYPVFPEVQRCGLGLLYNVVRKYNVAQPSPTRTLQRCTRRVHVLVGLVFIHKHQ